MEKLMRIKRHSLRVFTGKLSSVGTQQVTKLASRLRDEDVEVIYSIDFA
jgi:broad specificity phosphatase PhoE